MESLINDVTDWFLSKTEHIEVFAKNDSRVESWFKAELLVLFERLVKQGKMDSFEREPKLDINGRKQVDFRISVDGKQHYCELKAICISRSKGTSRGLFFYLDKNVGLVKDFRKLDSLKLNNKWILAFIYPKPKKEDWSRFNESIQKTFSSWRLITSLKAYPQQLFIAAFHAQHR